MKPCTVSGPWLFACATLLSFSAASQVLPEPADVIIRNAKVITVDSDFSIAQAVAVRNGKIISVGLDREIEQYRGLTTTMVDARGFTVMPGLFDANVESLKASTSEFGGPHPALGSIVAAQEYIRRQATNKSLSTNKSASPWIVLEWLSPNRLKEGRLPTKAELDTATTNYPVLWNFGSLAVVNSKALEVSKITKETSDPSGGEVVKDRRTYKPTGVLRKNAISLLKLPKPALPPTAKQQRESLKKLYSLYNEQGITSIGETTTGTGTIDLFRDMSRSNELTVRINVARLVQNGSNYDDTLTILEGLTNTPVGRPSYGPTGAGDDWVRIGALKSVLDGDLSMATAYLRTPYGIGPTYNITEPAYRGELKPDPFLFAEFYIDAAQRGWQLSAHATGDAALDFLLNCYEKVQFKTNIRERRFTVSHSAFQAAQHWERATNLGLVADLNPANLYEDGGVMLTNLGEQRLKYFLPLKSWYDKGLTVGAGSDHKAGLDASSTVNPWNPWFGMWTALTRETRQGNVINPDEKLTREQAIRFYTINNAYRNFEERKKGSVEPGKLADLIVVDTDLMDCHVDAIRNTRVLLTMVNGKIVWEPKPVEPVFITSTNQPAPTVTVTNLLTTLIVTNQVPAIADTNGVSVVATTNQPVVVTNQVTTIIVTNEPAVITSGTNTATPAATNATVDAVVAAPADPNTNSPANLTVPAAVQTGTVDTSATVTAAQPVAVPAANQVAATVTNQVSDISDWSKYTPGSTTQVQPAPVPAVVAQPAPVQPVAVQPTPLQVTQPQPVQVQSSPATVPQTPAVQPQPDALPVRARSVPAQTSPDIQVPPQTQQPQPQPTQPDQGQLATEPPPAAQAVRFAPPQTQTQTNR